MPFDEIETLAQGTTTFIARGGLGGRDLLTYDKEKGHFNFVWVLMQQG